MIRNFWLKLKKPFFCLAPMDQVSDCAFREMFAKYDKPDVIFTEFVSVDGLLHPEGKRRTLEDLKYTEKQRPIVAQVWGNDPKKFYAAAKIIAKLKFDGIDINMGCPREKEVRLGAGAALILNPRLAQEIIVATKKGAGGLPVSVKTRIGYSENVVKDWIKFLLEVGPAAITIHGRTKKEMSKVPARWDIIAKAVKVRDEMNSKTLIIGNGDIRDCQDGIKKAEISGVEGIMIGRTSFGNPWIFRKEDFQPSIEEKLQALLKHLRLFEKWYKNKKPFVIMRKHFKAYASGFPGAAKFRAKLMQARNAKEIKNIVEKFKPLLLKTGGDKGHPKNQRFFGTPDRERYGAV